jgi:GH25 family lysozyme M1 (1,4-beta-N-acetylmuramidase)
MTGFSVPRIRRAASVLAVLAAGLLAAAVATTPAQAATYVKGFDVSAYQGSVNWSSAYSSGARFAYVKATEGTYYTNPDFASQYNGSYNAGFIRGAYHFARPDTTSGATQADYFSSHGGGWSADGKTLPPALDIEYNPYGSECYGLSQSSMVSWVNSFVTEMYNKWHKYPMIYTTLDWWTTCTGNSSAFAAKDPFWIAKYSSTAPTPPSGSSFWTMWQYADSGTFPGDQDYFNGSMTQLEALATNHD